MIFKKICVVWLSTDSRLSLVIAVILPNGGIGWYISRLGFFVILVGLWSGSDVGGVLCKHSAGVGGKVS